MRIRTIKPEFWTHEALGSLPDFTQLLAIALLNYADDEGYFDANPMMIRGAVFPLRSDYRIITVALRDLYGIGYVEIFKTVGNYSRCVGRVVKFGEHQVINHAKASKLKAYCEYGNATVMLPEDYYQEWKGREQGTGNRREQKGSTPKPPRGLCAPSDAHEQEFEKFWQAYPRKKNKDRAKTAWNKRNPPLQEVLCAIERAKQDHEWRREGGQFIPYPEKWISAAGWQDGNGIDLGPREQRRFADDLTDEQKAMIGL